MAEDEPQERPRGFRAWLRHAFAVERFDESSLSDEDKDVLGRLAQRIHDKKLTSAAILWADSHRHLNFLGSQLLVFARPVFDFTHPLLNTLLGRFGLYIPPADYPKLQNALEKRFSIEFFVRRLEALSAAGYNDRPAASAPDEEAANSPEDQD